MDDSMTITVNPANGNLIYIDTVNTILPSLLTPLNIDVPLEFNLPQPLYCVVEGAQGAGNMNISTNNLGLIPAGTSYNENPNLISIDAFPTIASDKINYIQPVYLKANFYYDEAETQLAQTVNFTVYINYINTLSSLLSSTVIFNGANPAYGQPNQISGTLPSNVTYNQQYVPPNSVYMNSLMVAPNTTNPIWSFQFSTGIDITQYPYIFTEFFVYADTLWSFSNQSVSPFQLYYGGPSDYPPSFISNVHETLPIFSVTSSTINTWQIYYNAFSGNYPAYNGTDIMFYPTILSIPFSLYEQNQSQYPGNYYIGYVIAYYSTTNFLY